MALMALKAQALSCKVLKPQYEQEEIGFHEQCLVFPFIDKLSYIDDFERERIELEEAMDRYSDEHFRIELEKKGILSFPQYLEYINFKFVNRMKDYFLDDIKYTDVDNSKSLEELQAMLPTPEELDAWNAEFEAMQDRLDYKRPADELQSSVEDVEFNSFSSFYTDELLQKVEFQRERKELGEAMDRFSDEHFRIELEKKGILSFPQYLEYINFKFVNRMKDYFLDIKYTDVDNSMSLEELQAMLPTPEELDAWNAEFEAMQHRLDYKRPAEELQSSVEKDCFNSFKIPRMELHL